MSYASLHPLEKKFLRVLLEVKKGKLEDLAEASGLNMDQARRVVEWLKEKGLISINAEEVEVVELDSRGKEALQINPPEVRLANEALKKGSLDLEEAKHLLGDDAAPALGIALKLGLISLSKGKIVPRISREVKATEVYRVLEKLSAGPRPISDLTQEDLRELNELRKRPGYVRVYRVKDVLVKLSEGVTLRKEDLEKEEVTLLTSELISSGRWRSVAFSDIDMSQPAPAVYPARAHPLSELIRLIREIMEGLGFIEIEGPVVRSSFWNFDVLFTPQDHPARDMHDTFYLRNLRIEEEDRDLVQRVKSVHENGWITGSTGWGYTWDTELAWRALLRTHTTTVTAEAIYRGARGRLFTIGRVFRNEKPDYKHLVELHQMDAIVIEEGATIRKLMGYLTAFYRKLGFEKVKFWPTFFPYTEPSMQSMIYSEKLKDWIELCGMGVFRPEVTKPLGYDGPVLAWGMGLERLAMLIYDVDDIRELYENRLSFLRGYKSINTIAKHALI
ncbi:MAG: phenylalanine--tRNA ligase subunit alpha [Nitrososphaeria archaeon]